jgi:Protein of unknown function (DUF1592)/Protein of unknown function (DUF1588)/Protein of unknown function (DUF1585)/Protein of unknown function (DUF1595)/Protein of unknown function (DUF1587)
MGHKIMIWLLPGKWLVQLCAGMAGPETKPRATLRLGFGRVRAPWRDAARHFAATALCLVVACQGDNGLPTGPGNGSGGNDGPTGPGGADGAGAGGGASGSSAPLMCKADRQKDTGESVLRRLTKLEYTLTLKELFQLPALPSTEAIPDDNDRDGFRTLSALHTLSAQHVSAYVEVSSTLAKALLQDTARRDRVLGCTPTAADCLRAFTARFAELAYRRPVAASEIDPLVEKARANGLDQNDQFQFVIEVLLSSANFLFRVELGDKPEGLSTLAPHELAARLSFALWGRGPSRELLDQAAKGALSTREGLAQVVASMLADARTPEFFSAFFEQWLRFEELRAPTVKPADWNDALLGEMREETTRVLDDFAFGEGQDFLAALSANYTYVSPTLAKFYGLKSPGAGFARVEFAAGHPRERSGLLTHASLISAKSDGDPVAIRGNWLKKTFLCENLVLPAGLLDSIGDQLVGLTRIQIIKKRNEEAACKGCHAQIDPIGVGFAQFDATGRFDAKVKLSDYPIAAALPGGDAPGFNSMAELSAQLGARQEVASCLAKRVFLYTQGRDPLSEDGCAVDAASREFGAQKHGFLALVQGLVEADEFRLRRAPKP